MTNKIVCKVFNFLFSFQFFFMKSISIIHTLWKRLSCMTKNLLKYSQSFICTLSLNGRQGVRAGSWGQDSFQGGCSQLLASRLQRWTRRSTNWPPLVQKNVTWFTRGPNWPFRCLVGPKNVAWLTGGSNWPPLVQKRDVTHGGPKLTFYMFRLIHIPVLPHLN